jgi:translation elongation factor EF-G
MTDTDRIVNIQAKVPLSQLGSYSSEFRKLSSGNGTFAIEFDSYDQLTQKEYNELLNKKKF